MSNLCPACRLMKYETAPVCSGCAQIVSNLKYKFRKALAPWTDIEIATAFHDYSMSVDFGNEDLIFVYLPKKEDQDEKGC